MTCSTRALSNVTAPTFAAVGKSAKRTEHSRAMSPVLARRAVFGKQLLGITSEDVESWKRDMQSGTLYCYAKTAIPSSTPIRGSCEVCRNLPVQYKSYGLCKQCYQRLRSYYHRTHDAT